MPRDATVHRRPLHTSSMKPQDRSRGTAFVLDEDTMPSAPLWKILVFAIFNTGMVFSLVFVTGMLMPLQLVILVVRYYFSNPLFSCMIDA